MIVGIVVLLEINFFLILFPWYWPMNLYNYLLRHKIGQGKDLRDSRNNIVDVFHPKPRQWCTTHTSFL